MGGLVGSMSVVSSGNVGQSIPQRETEISREFQKLDMVTSEIEKILQEMKLKLEPILRSEALMDSEKAGQPDNMTKLGQGLGSMNTRLGFIRASFNSLLQRLEI